MQIALTKKLADAMQIKPMVDQEYENPLLSWTANWIKVWENRKAEDMLVLVNNVTRFTVAVYEVKRKDLKKDMAEMMKTAIINTLLSLNLNPEIVKEYMRLAGEVIYVRNSNRKATAWVTKAGIECLYFIDREYNGRKAKVFDDEIGASANFTPVNFTGKDANEFIPYNAMIDALTKLTGKQTFKYCAYELLITLDLEVYKVTRKIIVPSGITLTKLHKVLQHVFDWKNYHQYTFTVFYKDKNIPKTELVPSNEFIENDDNVVLIEKHILSEFLPECKSIIYTYDMGDNWEHEIQLIRVIDEFDKESPYLLEATGQTPPEDVGGVGGFIEFREIMMDPYCPEYTAALKWSKYWSPELTEWQKKPRYIYD